MINNFILSRKLSGQGDKTTIGQKTDLKVISKSSFQDKADILLRQLLVVMEKLKNFLNNCL
ncbi:hypothetical protein JM83_3427 [Gillisia sp. Hel_I_86]|nr:hypothetical protein JM83_3427 [Gillisia sp. Hel_I_86]